MYNLIINNREVVKPMAEIRIGDRIREIRLLQNKSRCYVADKAGIDTETLARYERNQREPVISTLVAIAEKGLGCSVEEILNPNPTGALPGGRDGRGRWIWLPATQSRKRAAPPAPPDNSA